MALAFADDVCMLAESVPQAQQLLDAAQEYYVAASATLCAPKSTFTGNFELQPWSIEIVLPSASEATTDQVDELEAACRLWIRAHAKPTQRGDRSSLYDVRELKGDQRGIKLGGDVLYLSGLGGQHQLARSEHRAAGVRSLLVGTPS